MFNALYPNVYRQLREMAGLTQEELGDALDISRYTMNKVEAGRAQLDQDQERKLFELAKCNKDEFGELLCRELSEHLGKKVGVDSGHGAYQPSTALAMAYALLRECGSNLPARTRRALNNRINTTQLLGLTYDRNNADLVELTEDCRETLTTAETRHDVDKR